MGRALVRSREDGDVDTQLCLRTGGNSGRSRPPPASPHAFLSNTSSPPSAQLQRHQPLTIFYSGRICVCDVTEVQARAIIAAAQRGTTTSDEREAAAPAAAEREEQQEEVAREQPPGGALLPLPVDVVQQHPTQQLSPGLFMKMSLQRFLQKRKTRAVTSASASPYARPHDHLRPRYRHLHQQQQLRQASLFL